MGMALALLAGDQARALDYAPTLDLSLLGGQYFFQGANANLTGNGNVTAAVAAKTGESWSVMPMFVGNYQGTKGVQDSVPAGSLFQQEMDYRASVTGIYQKEGSSWKLKPSASYKYEFMKQVTGETWANGLFDYEKIGMGFEAENIYNDPFSYRFGFDFFRLRWPNYQSLESAVPVDPLGNPLNRSGFNTNVLDTYNVQLSANGSRPYPYDNPSMSLQGGYSILYQSYLDQNVIDQTDAITGGGRVDYLQTLNAGVGYPHDLYLFNSDARLESKLGVTLDYNSSNQNFFDATTVQFFSNAYSYWSYGMGPSVLLSWGEKKRPASLGTSVNYTHLMYLNRQAEDGNGLYTGSTLWQDLYIWGINFAFPISQQFYLKAQTNFLWARSNNTFETTYAYNYRAANYLLGFSYEY